MHKQVEAELAELPLEERVEYLKSLGVAESGLGNLVKATYNLLGLRTYFTTGDKVHLSCCQSFFKAVNRN
jgi:obg-like ATPase 1